MLILTRRTDETIVIGDDVRITVVGVRGNQVRIGIDAPASVSVHREEIYDLLVQKSAATTKPDNTEQKNGSVGLGQADD